VSRSVDRTRRAQRRNRGTIAQCVNRGWGAVYVSTIITFTCAQMCTGTRMWREICRTCCSTCPPTSFDRFYRWLKIRELIFDEGNPDLPVMISLRLNANSSSPCGMKSNRACTSTDCGPALRDISFNSNVCVRDTDAVLENWWMNRIHVLKSAFVN
jgi:hypothetical protein